MRVRRGSGWIAGGRIGCGCRVSRSWLSGGFFTGIVDADSGALVSGVGQGGHAVAAARYRAGRAWMRAAVMSWTEPGSAGRDPEREPVGPGHSLDVAAVAVCLPRVPHVDDLALDAVGLLAAPVGGNDLAVQDHERHAFGPGPFQRLGRSGACSASTLDHLVDVPVRGRPGDAVVTGQPLDRGSGPGTIAAPAPPASSRSAPGPRATCPPAVAPPATARRRTSKFLRARQGWLDRRSRGVLQQKLILW